MQSETPRIRIEEANVRADPPHDHKGLPSVLTEPIGVAM